MARSSARRRNYRWTDTEIDQLIEWHALEFVPATPEGTLKSLSKHKQRALIKDFSKRLSDQILKKIEREVKQLRRRMPTLEDIPPKMLEAAARSCGDSEDFMKTLDACFLLAASLGYAIVDPPHKISSRMSIGDRRWLWASMKRQKDVLLEWTEIYEDIWDSLLWRECMEMRYGRRNRKALTYLSPYERRRLKAEAERLTQDSGTNQVSDEQVESAAAKIGRRRFKGVAHHLLKEEYIRACIHGGVEPNHWLNKPISTSGFFKLVAEPGPETSQMHELLQESFESRFCRYLCASPRSEDALSGEVIYHLVRLDSDLWQKPPTQSPELPGVVWPAHLNPDIEDQNEDFRRIAHCLTEELKLRFHVFNNIWSSYVTLTKRRYWEKRASTSMMVYWAARILEGLRPDIYKFYGKWIDHFHIKILRPYMKLSRTDRHDLAFQRAALEPFLYALTRDPLLNCVFHSEVLDGRRRLFPRQEYRRKDNRIPMQMIAFTVKLFRANNFRRPEISISDLLNDTISLQDHVRHAAGPSPRDLHIGGRSIYAYAAPLLAALINEPDWSLTAVSVKEIYHRYKDDPEVMQLLRDSVLRC